MIRIVLDTNVVVSAMLSRQGNEAMVLRMVRSGVLRACVSLAVLEEYESVLRRSSFHLPKSSIDELLRFLRVEAMTVSPQIAVNASPDEPDNRFIECAESSKAEFLVTGNKRHLPKMWNETRIVSARELLMEPIY